MPDERFSTHNPQEPDYDRDRVLDNLLTCVAALTADINGWNGVPLLYEYLETPQVDLPEDVKYRIAGAFSLAETILEYHCNETGQSPEEVLRLLGIRAQLARTPPEPPEML